MQIGDLVILKEDKNPIIYRIEKTEGDMLYLKGYTHRLKKVVDEKEAEPAPSALVEKEDKTKKKYEDSLAKTNKERSKNKPIFGRILHIDGDQEYLENCIALYEEVGIHAEGVYIDEKEMKHKIEDLLLLLTPDIIVITGHDIYNGKGLKDLNNYENTKDFMEVVRIIRKHYLSEAVCVIVGACASNFEALIASGANFASSPKRINIHTYDPAVLAIKVASTSCNKTMDFEQCLRLIENGRAAFGGIETKGKMKILL